MTLLRRPSSPFFEQDSFSTSVMCWYMGVDSLKASKLTAQNTTRVSTMPSSLKTRRRRASSPMFDFFLCRAAATCAQPRAVSKRLRCTGDRMCHRTRVLQGWYRQTGDEVLQERARVCNGRCRAWGLSSPKSETNDAQRQWTGHLVRPSTFQRYNAPGYPLRQEGNTSAHKLRAACCHAVNRSKAP